MLPIEIQQQIIDELNINGRVIVAGLITLCQVSQETIPRDLTHLKTRGLLQRSHGGAVPAKLQVTNIQENSRDINEYELSFCQSMNEHVDAKMAVAKRALDFISPGDCLLFDQNRATPCRAW